MTKTNDITTMAELDALPAGTVITDDDNLVWMKYSKTGDNRWHSSDNGAMVDPTYYGPFHVLVVSALPRRVNSLAEFYKIEPYTPVQAFLDDGSVILSHMATSGLWISTGRKAELSVNLWDFVTFEQNGFFVAAAGPFADVPVKASMWEVERAKVAATIKPALGTKDSCWDPDCVNSLLVVELHPRQTSCPPIAPEELAFW